VGVENVETERDSNDESAGSTNQRCCFLECTSLFPSKYLSSMTFFNNFDHPSYSKNCAIIIFFLLYALLLYVF
jgi:Ca2+/H+ antiporter